MPTIDLTPGTFTLDAEAQLIGIELDGDSPDGGTATILRPDGSVFYEAAAGEGSASTMGSGINPIRLPPGEWTIQTTGNIHGTITTYDTPTDE